MQWLERRVTDLSVRAGHTGRSSEPAEMCLLSGGAA
jgi:hypothetical protein